MKPSRRRKSKYRSPPIKHFGKKIKKTTNIKQQNNKKTKTKQLKIRKIRNVHSTTRI